MLKKKQSRTGTLRKSDQAITNLAQGRGGDILNGIGAWAGEQSGAYPTQLLLGGSSKEGNIYTSMISENSEYRKLKLLRLKI